MPTIIDVLEHNARTIHAKADAIRLFSNPPTQDDVSDMGTIEERLSLLNECAGRYGGSNVTEALLGNVQRTLFKMAVEVVE